MPALLSGCRSGASFDSIPRGQRGPNAAIHKLGLQRLQQSHDGDDFGASRSGYASGSSRPSSPFVSKEGDGSTAAGSSSSSSQPASPVKKNRMRPVENIASAKVERARSSPFPQSAPTSPRVNHAQAHSHHGPGTPPVRAKHRFVDKRQIGLPTNFQHTGHIGRSSYSAATSMMDSAAIKAQLSQVAAALSLDINLDQPAEEQVAGLQVSKDSGTAVVAPETEDVEAPSSPEMEPLPSSRPVSPSKPLTPATRDVPASPLKADKTLPSPPSSSHGYAEASIRVVSSKPLALDGPMALPSPPSAVTALPAEPLSSKPWPARRGPTASTMSPASNFSSQHHRQDGRSPPPSPPKGPRTAGPANGQALRRKPVPRASDFVELTPEQAAAQAEREAQAVALQRKASSASASKKLESLRRDMMDGLGSVDDASASNAVATVPEDREGEENSEARSSSSDDAVVPSAGPSKPSPVGLAVPGTASAAPLSTEPSIGSQLLAPRFLPPPARDVFNPSSSSSGASPPTSGLPAHGQGPGQGHGTIRIDGKAFVEGPSGSLITRTANTRWNSALAEITAALAGHAQDGADGAGAGRMLSREEEEALMVGMGIPLGPSVRGNQAGGITAMPSETVRLKAELAEVAPALSAMENSKEGGGA